jgi:hypothetical protein
MPLQAGHYTTRLQGLQVKEPLAMLATPSPESLSTASLTLNRPKTTSAIARGPGKEAKQVPLAKTHTAAFAFFEAL